MFGLFRAIRERLRPQRRRPVAAVIIATDPLFRIDEALMRSLRQSSLRNDGVVERDDFEQSRDAFMLFGGMGPIGYLTADGCVAWRDAEFWGMKGTRADAFRYVALGAKRLKLPTLLSILPPRPTDALDCAKCHGKGWYMPGGTMRDQRGELLAFPCGDCGALGWQSPALDVARIVARPIEGSVPGQASARDSSASLQGGRIAWRAAELPAMRPTVPSTTTDGAARASAMPASANAASAMRRRSLAMRPRSTVFHDGFDPAGQRFVLRCWIMLERGVDPGPAREIPSAAPAASLLRTRTPLVSRMGESCA